MSIKALSEINNNYHVALAIHRELADVFWFLYLPGFALMHEYQLISENLIQRKLKRYISSTYHVFEPDRLPKSANITEPLLLGKNRKNLKVEETWRITREVFRIYIDWEEATLKKYEQIAVDIFNNGDISVFNFISEIIKEVKQELVFITDLSIGLSAMDWDMPTIVDQQDTIFERYEYLIKNLLGKSQEYHHWNSNIDPESRIKVLDKNV